MALESTRNGASPALNFPPKPRRTAWLSVSLKEDLEPCIASRSILSTSGSKVTVVLIKSIKASKRHAVNSSTNTRIFHDPSRLGFNSVIKLLQACIPASAKKFLQPIHQASPPSHGSHNRERPNQNIQKPNQKHPLSAILSKSAAMAPKPACCHPPVYPWMARSELADDASFE